MTDAQQSQPEKPTHPLVVLREQMAAREQEFRAALPPHISPARFMRTALTAVQINPELAAADRRTLFNALMRAANDGLLPDGRQGAIVCFNDNNPRSPTKGLLVAQWMPMVAGLLTRFRNSGQFKSVTADIVREGETFRHWVDEHGEHLLHEPGDGEGKVIKAYAMAQTKDGGVMIRVMSRADIEKRRAVSRAKDGPMWREWWDEAAMKTVLRNLHKRLPSSSDDLDRLVERDQELYGDTMTTAKELPADLHGDHQASGVVAALDQFGGRAPAAGEDASSASSSQPQESAQAAKESGNGQQEGQLPLDGAAKTQSEQSPTEIARARGQQAKRDGVQRRAIPGEYRAPEREAEANAWREGWDNP